MPQDINPFEPWRPPGFEATRREDPRSSAKEVAPPRTPALFQDGPPQPRPWRADEWAVGLLLLGVAVLAIVLCTQLPQGHYTRVVAAVLALGIGTGAAVSAARKCRWRVRLALLGAGLGGAAAAWVFVPTTQGLSLWTAHAETERHKSQLGSLQAGDMAGFSRESQVRMGLMKQFTSFQPRILKAENAWLERTVAKCEENLKIVTPTDTEGFRKQQTLRRELSDWLKSVRQDQLPADSFRVCLEEAENAWLKRSVAKWEDDLKKLPVQNLKPLLALHGAAQPVLSEPKPKELRDRMAQAELGWLERRVAFHEEELNKLPVQQFEQFKTMRADHGTMPDLGLLDVPLRVRLATAEKDWIVRTFDSLPPGDYKAAGKTRDYCPAEHREGPRIRDAEEAWASRTADAVMQQAQQLLAKSPLKASSLLSQAAKDLAAFGDFAAVQDRLRKERRLAVAGRVKAAQIEFQQWIKVDRDEEVNDVANRLVQDIAPEAKAVGLEKPVNDFCAACRLWAELANKKKHWEWAERLSLISAFPQPGMPVTLSVRAVWIQRGSRKPPDHPAR
jgi:hypothetical protein